MIVFRNDGVVPIAAFTTFGMSAKPGSTNPIGKFGTGLKNAVAIVLRLGGTFRLWRGLEEYEFYTKDEDFRGQTFARVRMKRRRGILSRWTYEEMPFTTELGKHWKPWMAVRELEANCRDENGTSFCSEQDHEPREGTTMIQVDCPEFEAAYLDLDNVFLSPSRPLIYEDDLCRIYEGESQYLFYRGMRITDLRKPSLYTYEVKNVWLTEDRTSQYSFLDDSNIKKSLLKCPNLDVVRRVIKEHEGHHEANFDWDAKAPSSPSHAWAYALGSSGVSGRFVALRDNLRYGLNKTEEVEVKLTVSEWEEVLTMLVDANNCPAGLKIRKQMVEAGWKDPVAEIESPDDEEDEIDALAAKEDAELGSKSREDILKELAALDA